MSTKTVIIDYDMGNVASVQKALNFIQEPSIISNKKSEILNADYLILPGVGSFFQGMENLKKHGLVDVLNEAVIINKKPILGICLGMQLFADKGSEPFECDGLGWIRGNVSKINVSDLRIPHLGWNNIKVLNSNWIQFDNKDFYFIHSYHFQTQEKDNILASVNYGVDFVAAIQNKNILATQFHPEKSQNVGLMFLKHFYKVYA